MLIWAGEEQRDVGTSLAIEDGRLLKAGDGKPCWFAPPYKGCAKRVDAIDLIAFHWTGGEGGCERVAGVLRTRTDGTRPTPLSIHFVIDYDGRIVQMADPVTTVCYHAGKVNGRSIGIEMSNRAALPAQSNRPRRTRTTRINNGRVHRHADFTDKQYKSALELSNLLAHMAEIPRVAPLYARKVDLSGFRGACEHIHAGSRSNKVDCCGAVMEHLIVKGGWDAAEL